MENSERAKAIEKSLRLLRFLDKYKFSVSIVNGFVVVAFDSISQEARARLNEYLTKWTLEHIIVWDKSKEPIKK